MKKCSSCEQLLPLRKFSKNRAMSDGMQNVCKDCQKKSDQKKGIISKEDAVTFHNDLVKSGKTYLCKSCAEVKTAEQFYHIRRHGSVSLNTASCKECQKTRARKVKFPDIDYHNLLNAQHGVCAICGISEDTYEASCGKKFAVDHDHATGKVRGLLCSKCNQALGLFQDDTKVLESAIKYILQNR